MMWMFLAILITFLVTRIVTEAGLIGQRYRKLGNVHIGGNHVHHGVPGTLVIIGTGVTLVSQTPRGAALDAAAAVFGVDASAPPSMSSRSWLHLEDVYWAEQGPGNRSTRSSASW